MRSLIGKFNSSSVRLLNAIARFRDEFITINCIACLAKDNDINLLVHALQDESLINSNDLQCNLTFFLCEGDALPYADVLMRRYGLITNQWRWMDIYFRDTLVSVDASYLLRPSIEKSCLIKSCENTLYISQNFGMIEVTIPRDVVDDVEILRTFGQ